MMPTEFLQAKYSSTNGQSCPAVRASGRIGYTTPSINPFPFREIKSQLSSSVKGSINNNNNNNNGKGHLRPGHEGTGSLAKLYSFFNLGAK